VLCRDRLKDAIIRAKLHNGYAVEKKELEVTLSTNITAVSPSVLSAIHG
jgi:hypothetical protein